MAPQSQTETTYDVLQAHSKAVRARADFDHRCKVLRERLCEQNLLNATSI